MDEIPEGLDDLLNSIRGGGSSALALRKKDTEDNIVDERIDERILRLLGLEDVTDIDYSTYKTLLRERVAAARMGDSSIPTEEVELVTEEFKRVKSKTGRFKVKKSAIKKDAFFGAATAAKTRASKRRGGLRALPAAIDNEEEKSEEQDQFVKTVLAPSLVTIEKNLEGILDTLTKQYQLDKKESEIESKEKEKAKKAGREAKLEGKDETDKVKTTAEKIAKPAKGIFDVIKDFIINTLMGGSISRIIEILRDPAGVFERTWKGAINAIIGVLNSILKTVFDFILQPFNLLIGQLDDALRSIESNINKALSLFGQEGISLPNLNPIPVPQIPTLELPQEKTEVPGMVGGGLINSKTGSLISGMGKDTQLVALSPGEVVMSNKAGDMYGRDNLLAMNASAGGTNKPKKGKVMGFEGGGILDFIGSGEGGYNSMNQGTQGNRIVGSTHNASSKLGKNLTDMTIGEIMDRQSYLMNKSNPQVSDYGIFAAGKYQIIPGTMPGAVSAAKLSRDDMFSPDNQDKLGMALITTKRPRVGAYLSGRSNDLHGAMEALSLEFASIPDPDTGLSKYGSGNRTAHTVEEVRNALIRSRQSGDGVKLSPQNKNKSFNLIESAPSSSGTNVKVVYAPTGAPEKSAATAGSSANQKRIPAFSAIDANNFEMLVIKSIYNIAG